MSQEKWLFSFFPHDSEGVRICSTRRPLAGQFQMTMHFVSK